MNLARTEGKHIYKYLKLKGTIKLLRYRAMFHRTLLHVENTPY